LNFKRFIFVLIVVLFFSFEGVGNEVNEVVELRTFEEGFQEKYTGREYRYEGGMNWFQKLVQKILNWLRPGRDVDPNSVLQIVEYIFYTFIILAVVFIIVKAILNKEGRWIFGKRSDKFTIPFESTEENIYETDFNELITKAIKAQNYRLAIRYYYLMLLKKLSDVALIVYDPEKTNADYHNELKTTKIAPDFTYTSYLYNYSWYGEFQMTRPEFQQAENAFNQLLKKL